MKNDAVKSIVVLGSICLVVALLLSSVNLVTDPLIKQAEQNAANEAFYEVLPNATEFETITLGDDVPSSVLELRRDKSGSGYAFKLNVTGTYSGTPMTLIVGIGPDGKITKLSFVEYTDSPGIGSPEGFNALFAGKDNTTADNDAGATITTNAIKAALNDAYTVLGQYSTIEQSDEQKLSALYNKLMPQAANPVSKNYSFKKIDLSQFDGLTENLIAAFSPSNEVGYVALVNAGDKTVAVAVNAFGKAYSVYDLDGNDLTDNVALADAKKTAEALPPIYISKNKVNTRRIKNALKNKFGEESIENIVLDSIQLSDISSTVVAAYKVRTDGKDYRAFISHAVGYGGTVKVLYIMDTDGNIVLYKTASQSESKGYGAAISESTYADSIVGNNIGVISDDTVLISGATVTSEAVKMAKNDIKVAFEKVKEGF